MDSTGKEKAFFREYRLATESNKRAPLLVVHVWFKDSVVNQASGTFVKTFLESGEKRIAESRTWDVEGKHVDINSLILVQVGDSSTMMAIEAFDTGSVRMDTTYGRTHGAPIIRKAIAEGFLDSAKAHGDGKTLVDDIGVAFMRNDPKFGMIKLKFGIQPRDYMTPEEFKKWDESKKAENLKKAGAEKKSPKTAVKKSKPASKKADQSAP